MKFNKKSFLKSLYKISTVLFLVGYNFAPSFLAIGQLRDMGGEITPKAAFAASYTLSSTNGIWTAITGGSGLTHSPLYDNEIRWGNPVNTGKRSGLRFDGKGETSFNANEPFLIGDFTHFNWATWAGTQADSATLKVTLNFSNPEISPSPTFSYKFGIEETSNTKYLSSCDYYGTDNQVSETPCDDIITFPNGGYGEEVYEIGDMKYTLKIDGFKKSYPDGATLDKFVTEEEKENVAYLVGRLSSTLIEKPAISIKKYVAVVTENQEDVWHDANTAPGVYIGKGDEIKFKYVVQNTGNVDLTNIVVTDDKGVTVSCPQTSLEVGAESMTCNSVGNYYADLGLYTNIGTVVGTHVGGTVTASDPANYTGVNKIRICHATGSHTNPYNSPQASMTADVQGHDSHHHENNPPRVWYPGIQGTWDDIIPPFDYYGGHYPGKNWNDYGKSVYYNNCDIPTGTLKVNKVTIPAGDTTEFAITGSGTPSSTGAPTFMNGNTGVISGGTSHTFTVYPGTYSVAETVTDGWEPVSNTCNGIEIANGENKECIITNTKYSSLTIIKNALPSSEEVFSFTTEGEGLSAFTLVDNDDNSNPSKVFDLLPGTYSVNEIVPPNWYLDGVTCTGNKDHKAITLSAGENITCTFNNIKYGSISGHKYHDLDGLASTTNDRKPVQGYTIFIDANKNKILDPGEKSTTTAIDGSYSFTGLEPGEYTIAEVMKIGWIVLPGTSTAWTIELSAGVDKEDIDFINIEKPTIKIIKFVDTDGDGKVDVEYAKDWTWKLDDKEYEMFGKEDKPMEILPGTYAISEIQKDGYDVKSMMCDNGGVKFFEEKTEGTKLTINSGDKILCRFTNTRDTGTLIVRKEVVNDNGGKLVAEDFSFQIGTGKLIGFKPVSGNPLLAENVFVNFPTGTYSITEKEANTRGYATTYDNCEKIVVKKGEKAVCTIKNDDIAPELTVIKNVINEGNDGTKKAEDFEITVHGKNVSTPTFDGSENGVTVTLNVGEYKVTEKEDTENYKAEYSKDCSGVIGLGEKKTCIITNTGIDHMPSIIVTKTAGVTEIPETGGKVTFTYEVTNTGAEPVEITSLYDDQFGDLDGEHNCKVGTILGVGKSCTFAEEFEIPANEPGDPDAPTTHKNIFTAKAKDDEENEVEDTDDEVITLTPVPSLKLVKNVVHKYNSDTSITAADWTLYATGDGGFNYAGDTDQFRFVKAGVPYTLSEEGIYSPQFEASDWTCPGGELTGSTLTLAAEDDIVCTITNTALPAAVKVYKDVLDGFSKDIFKVQLEDGGEVQDISDTEDADKRLVAEFTGLDAGTYNPEEVELPDGYIAQGCVPVEGYSATVRNGEETEFVCINKVIDPILQIEKSNDAVVTLSAGDIVTYTITVTAPDDGGEGTYILNNVIVSDIAPAGFEYMLGSWTVEKNSVDITGEVPEPTYDGENAAQWMIGGMKEGDVVVLTYQTKIFDKQDPGNYPDIAWVAGTSLIDGAVLGASVVDPLTPFVGTNVTITEPVETEEGEVLGASITLPVTGASTYLTLGALIMMILGAITLLLKPFKKLSYALLTGLMALSFVILLTPNRVLAADSDIQVRIMQPATPTNKTSFNVGFVALDLNDNEVTVECYKDGTLFKTIPNANAGNCPATVDASGTYTFYVIAKSASGEQKSEDAIVVVDLVKPSPVIDYSKAGNVIKFKTGNDGKTKKVEIHRSTTPKYTANESTMLDSIPVSPNNEYSWTDTTAEAGKTYYYALRTVDAVGNTSTIVSDPEVVAEEVPATTGTGTGTTTPTEGEVAGQTDTKKEGEVAGETDDITEGEDTEVKKTEEGKEKVDIKETGKNILSKWYFWVIVVVVIGGIAFYVKKQKSN